MKYKIKILTILLLFSIINLKSQVKYQSSDNINNEYNKDDHNPYFDEDKIYEISDFVYSNGWFDIKKELNIPPETFFIQYKHIFGLGENDEMELYKVQEDKYGWKHYNFKQKYKGIYVKGMGYILHCLDGRVDHANGKLCSNLNINVISGLDETTVKQICNDLLLSNISINNIQYELKNELIIAKFSETNSEKNAGEYKLYFKIFIDPQDHSGFASMYIDAQTGKVEESNINIRVREEQKKALNDVLIDDVDTKWSIGDVDTKYGYGNRQFITKKRTFDYILHDEAHGDGIHTKNVSEGGFVSEYKDGDNHHWDDNTQENAAATAHWALQEAWEYYWAHFDLNGVDGDGIKISVRVAPHLSTKTGLNELWDKIWIDFGKHYDWEVSADVVSHEYTHGVIFYTDGPSREDNYSEHAALNEGYCDIMGADIEFEIELDGSDWTMGENCLEVPPNGPRRFFDNPSADNNSASFVGDEFWNSSSMCYYRAGVLRKWYYLLSHGELFNDIQVSGLGRFYAATNAFLTFDEYLQENSNFEDARFGSIQVAENIYGKCSNQVYQTINAWNAVRVIPDGNGTIFGENVIVPCVIMNLHHDNGFSYFAQAGNDLESNCEIFDGKTTTFIAGNSIRLLPGFKSGKGPGTHFHAYIEECGGKSIVIDNVNRNYVNEYRNDPVIIEKHEIINKVSVNIFPNPNNGIFKIEYTENTDDLISVEVTNIMSNIVFKKEKIQAGSVNIDISEYPAGIYVVKTTIGKNVFVEKIIYQ